MLAPFIISLMEEDSHSLLLSQPRQEERLMGSLDYQKVLPAALSSIYRGFGTAANTQ